VTPVLNFEVRPFGYGGGVRLHWLNPADAAFHHVKIIRKTVNSFSGHNDPAATVIYSGKGVQTAPHQTVFRPSPAVTEVRHRCTIDSKGVLWATTYYYAIYAMNVAENDVSVAVVKSGGTPDVSVFEEVDVIGLLLEYISAYFKRQIAVQGLKVPSGVTELPVLDSPPLIENVKFPCISIHLDTDAPEGYSIGDDLNQLSAEGDATVHRRGYLAGFTLSITGWTENPEIRRHLYRHLKGCLLSARQLLEQSGVVNTRLTGRYAEDFEGYNMPLFSAAFSLTGQLQASVRVVPIEATITTITVNQPALSPVALQEGG
jgi:hypothetical protein